MAQLTMFPSNRQRTAASRSKFLTAPLLHLCEILTAPHIFSPWLYHRSMYKVPASPAFSHDYFVRFSLGLTALLIAFLGCQFILLLPHPGIVHGFLDQ
jgi:hypothetical protein